jgi:hypothetical protein
MTIDRQLEGWGFDMDELRGWGRFSLSNRRLPRAFSPTFPTRPTKQPYKAVCLSNIRRIKEDWKRIVSEVCMIMVLP